MLRIKPTKVILAYCDGACDKQGFGGWGYRIEYPGGKIDEGSGGAADTTNNRMELEALIRCIQALPEQGKCYVFTDSQYVQKGATIWVDGWIKNNWTNFKGEPVKNQEFWLRVFRERNHRPEVEIKWIRGHDGNAGNERVDVLATQARRAVIAALFDRV